MNSAAPLQDRPLTRIAICGSGLALRMAAAALARHLPPIIQVLCVNFEDAPAADIFLGSLAPPSAYAFNLAAGVTEPRLLLDTATAFCWGSRISEWGAERKSWAQCFHLPLPVPGGVPFHHYLVRADQRDLEPFLMPAMAAKQGVFAHPLEKGAQALARAEYGYQFDAQSYQVPFAAAAASGRVQIIAAKLAGVDIGAAGISALRLADGQTVRADLYVDCSGPAALLRSPLGGGFSSSRRLRASLTRRRSAELGAPLRRVVGASYGWQSETPLQGAYARLTVFAPESEPMARAAHGAEPDVTSEVTLGTRESPWSGNCVALGQAAGVLEPLTQAPMLLLQRDIERLATLIPFTAEMSMERREFNRQSGEDYSLAGLFQRAFFETAPLADSPYWQAARAEPVPARLASKLELFARRGSLVAFDLEPFNAEDWLILHLGMGRWPRRHDRVADRVPEAEVQQLLSARRQEIQKLVQSMPGHHRYVTQLAQHLRQRNL